MTKRDDQFECEGRTWQRSWTGDLYRWTTVDGLEVGWWRIVYDEEIDEHGVVTLVGRREYYAEVGGASIGFKFRSTKEAMLAAGRAMARKAA